MRCSDAAFGGGLGLGLLFSSLSLSPRFDFRALRLLFPLFPPQERNEHLDEVNGIYGRSTDPALDGVDDDFLADQLKDLMAEDAGQELDNIDLVDRQPAATADSTGKLKSRTQAVSVESGAVGEDDLNAEDLEQLEELKMQFAV